MNTKIPSSIDQGYIEKCISALTSTDDARQATLYLTPRLVITATFHNRANNRDRSLYIVLKLGAPNARERSFISSCVRSGEPFPVRRVQLRFYPKRK